MVSYGINDVETTSVHPEKTRLKKLRMMMMMMMMIIIIIIIIIIMNKSQETTVFQGHRILTSTTKLRKKSDGRLQIWCSVQISVHRETPEVGLLEKLTRSLYWCVCQHYIESATKLSD